MIETMEQSYTKISEKRGLKEKNSSLLLDTLAQLGTKPIKKSSRGRYLNNKKRIAKSGLPTLSISPGISIEKSSSESVKYRFVSQVRNPYWDFEKLIPIRPCLNIHNNSDKILQNINTGEEVFNSVPDYISECPKRYVNFEKSCRDGVSNFQTDDFKMSHNRRRKASDKFCNFYERLYLERKVSVLFFTLTRSDYVQKDISTMLDALKVRLKALKTPLRGYFWVLELKRNKKMVNGYHIHYHLVVAIDRVNWRRIPKKLKLEELWGQRTGVGFVEKSVRSYLKKELVKSNAKILRRRMYGISQKFK